MYNRVYDVLLECEDFDHVRIHAGNRVIASGTWYMDCILEQGNKSVIRAEYDNSIEVPTWNIYIKKGV